MAEVEAGGDIAVTRYGKVVARLVPGQPATMAADAFRDFWQESEIDLQAPADPLAEDVPSLDD